MGKYIKFLTSIIIISLTIVRLGNVLAANYDGNKSMISFYKMERNTADVIFYGSSHIYAGVNTVDLWDDYGIAGYNLSGSMQTLWNTYYNMEESLKYQSPQMMVVDLYGLLIQDEYSGASNVIKNVSSMRFSLNKIENIWNSVPHEEFLSYLASYPLTHDSYRELKQENYDREIDSVGGKWYKGYKPSYGVTGYNELPHISNNDEKKIPTEKNRKYLDKITQLAQKHRIQLAFIIVPYEGVTDEEQKMYNWAKNYVEENEILFLDGNMKLVEMGFDPAADYAEASHLNYYGSCKFTEYLGKWLKDNCNLEDHRGENKWNSWQKYSNCWAAYNQNRELAQCADINTYLEKIRQREDYLVIVSLDNNYKGNPYVQPLEELLGSNPYELGSFASIVLENNTVIYQTPDEPEYLWYMETALSDVAVSKTYDDFMKVSVNNVQINNYYDDVTILVYDKTLDKIADVVSYNSDGKMIHN